MLTCFFLWHSCGLLWPAKELGWHSQRSDVGKPFASACKLASDDHWWWCWQLLTWSSCCWVWARWAWSGSCWVHSLCLSAGVGCSVMTARSWQNIQRKRHHTSKQNHQPSVTERQHGKTTISLGFFFEKPWKKKQKRTPSQYRTLVESRRASFCRRVPVC